MAKITFVVVDIIFKEDVITSSVAKITYIVVEISKLVTFKVAVVTSSVAKFLSDQDHLCGGQDTF